jgi:branched-chain amino acid transport system ATP-binding protein
MLEVTDLEVRYGGHLAVSGVNLTLRPGEVTALIGANGAGKTSTLSAISGAVRATSGRVVLEGRAVTGMKPHRLVKLGVTHVPEGRKVVAPLTVEENLLLGAYSRRHDRAAVKSSLEDCYQIFPILRERRGAPSGVLSGGEQQMLAFGRALMADPKVVLLDEPTMGLAPTMVEIVTGAIQEMRRRDLAILLVEQNGAAVSEVADYVVLLERGRCVGEGPASEIGSEKIMQALLGLSEVGIGPALSERRGKHV